MCGRNSLLIDQADLETRFDVEVVTDGGGSDEIVAHRWGLIPFWADDLEKGIIDGRSKTTDEKRVFEQAWELRPCSVLSSEFYEWQSPNGGSKQRTGFTVTCNWKGIASGIRACRRFSTI